MASVTGPDFLALQVRDLAASADFYQRRLGLRRAPSSPPGAVVFTTQPVPFAVRDPLPGVDHDASERPGIGVALWLCADDAQALHDGLVAADVTIATEPFDSPFGRTSVFVDPDGYQITVHDGA